MRTSLDQLLASQPFMAGLSPEQFALVAGCARNVALVEGAKLCVEGASADTFFLLRRGHVSVEVHSPGRRPVVIETVGPGRTVGWSWLVPPYRWTFDARAMEPVGAIAIDGACLREKSLEDPALGFALLSNVAQELLARLQATRLRLLDLYGAPDG